MNNIVIKGRICNDLEINATNSGKQVLNFTVAVNRRFNREKADFVRCQAWEKTGAFIAGYFEKGQEILLRGALQNEAWTDKEGNKRDSWQVLVDEVEFCGSRSHGEKSDFDNDLPFNDDDAPF